MDRRARHLDVESGVHRLGGAVQTEPVRDHDAVKAPFAAQHTTKKPLVIGAEHTVQPVVTRHHCPHAGPNGGFERHQIQLAQRPLIDVGRHRCPPVLGVVAHEMLHTARNTVGLHTVDVRRGDIHREPRVFAHALEVATTDRCAMQVHGGRQQHVG